MGYNEADPLDGMPPTKPLRTARPKNTAALAMPRPSSSTLSMTGTGPTISLMSKMQAIEKLVGEISRELPETANAFGPAIQLMRDLGAARLADQATGGAGATNPEAAALPPMGAGPGGMMPPPPMI